MRLITSESVSCGHPDKIADQISDAILDAYLTLDPNAKVAVETMVKDNCVVLGGEITSAHSINYDNVVKSAIEEIGYHNPKYGFNCDNVTIINLIGKQSSEINSAVLQNGEESLGAGDQGFMTGFATNETDTYMPIGMYVAKKLADYVYSIGFGPDIKTQVTIEEWPDQKRIHTILISAMHKKYTIEQFRSELYDALSRNNMGGLQPEIVSLIDKDTKIVINPAGAWYVGGPVADCGVTGRKIVVDQYGPYNPVGGGAFSGKDPSKVDRSGAYLARYIAKNIVAAGFADKCAVEIAYMIGVNEPASLNINTFGQYSDELLVDIVSKIFPLTPSQIINHFKLKRPIYFEASRGHFGNDTMPWEKLDKVEYLKELLNPLGELVGIKPLVENSNIDDDDYDDDDDEDYDDDDDYDDDYDEDYDDDISEDEDVDEERENYLNSIKIDCAEFSVSDFIEKYGITNASEIMKVLVNNGCVSGDV